MKSRTIISYAAAMLTMTILLSSCASQTAGPAAGASSAYSKNSVTLDEAIDSVASYFIEKLPASSKMAIVAFEAETDALSDYVFEEIWNRFEDSGNFVLVDRRNLERIRDEMNYQMSGEVSEESARSIGHQYGPQSIVYGQITRMGTEFRMALYATDVETASSSQRALTVRPDSRITSLIDAGLDEKIDRAVAAMARSVNQKTTIAVGRISYTGTQTVSNLSAYLKNSITTGAQKQQKKFLVASDSETAEFAVETRGLTVEAPAVNSSIQAVVVGSFSPLDNDAEVSFQLVSTGRNKTVLAAAGFVIPGTELSRRRLSLLPEKDTAVITKAEFDAKQTAIDPYAGRNNKFTFTATPDDLDGVYYDGEAMSMRIYSDRDCYFRIVQVDVNGDTQVIYPHSKSQGKDNPFIRAGETRSIPDYTKFRMQAPFGEEYILVAAYDRPFTIQEDPGGQISNSTITRGLKVESESGGKTQLSPVATAKFSYTILPRN